MNLDRLRWGEWIAAIAALDLLLVTFRAWYKVSGGDGRVTAWDALDNGRYLLIATAVVGVFLLLIRAAEDTQQLSFPPGWLAAAVGFACTVYVAYRLASPPSDNLDPDIGLYLGLVSALGVTIGGLLSAREPDAAAYAPPAVTEAVGPAGTLGTPPDTFGDPALAQPAGGGGTWSPAAPVADTTGWSPASPAAPVPPATPAGAIGGERPLQAGDSVVLTAGGARFPAGTVAQVVEAFAGGALVEVRAPDGMAERFEVPESAYERAPAGGAAAAQAGESWSPAMPAPASDDWGFEETGAARDVEGTATETLDAPGEDKPKKTPWWKREIGGGKKKDDDGHGGELAAAGAAAGAAAVEAGTNGAGEERPGFFKRLFGGGGAKDEGATETLEPETSPASDVAGLGEAAESDTAVDEPVAESAVADEPSVSEPVVEPIAAEPEPPAPEPVAEPEPIAAEPEPEPPAPEPPAPEPEPEPVAAAPEPEPEPVAMDPEPEPEPIEPAPEPEVAAEPEPPAAPEPEVVASDDVPPAAEPAPVEPEPTPPAPEPEAAGPPTASEPDVSPAASTPDPTPGAEAAGAGAAAAAAAAAGTEDEPKPRKRSSGSRKVPAEALGDAGGTEDQPKPRKRSSGSRKVPKEALAAADTSQPKVGDEVQLKVGGGKFDAGTKGTVVDVFSAGVIVELSDDEGRTERLDLPFEAIGPADA